MYPVWLCPFKLPNQPGQLQLKSGKESEMFVDIGVYGVPKAKGYETVSCCARYCKLRKPNILNKQWLLIAIPNHFFVSLLILIM